MKKKRMFGIVIILIIAAAAIFAVCWSNRKWKLSDVEHLHFRDGFLYFVDRGDDGCLQIVRSDQEGKNGRMILCDINEKEMYRSALQMFFDDEGNAYLLMKENDDRKASLVIYSCDFENGKLEEEAYDLTSVIGQSENVYVQGIRGDSLYYFSIPYSVDGEAELCTIDDNGNVLCLDSLPLQYPYLKSQFFLSENNVILWMNYEGEVFAKQLGSDQMFQIEGITGIKGIFANMTDNGGYTAYVLDHQQDCIREINLMDLTSDIIYRADELGKGFSFGDLIGPCCSAKGFCGAVQKDGGAEEVILCFYHNGIYHELFEISLTGKAVFQETSVYIWAILGLAAVLCVYWYIYCTYKVQSIFFRIIVLFLIGMLGGDYLLGVWVNGSLQEHLETNQTMSLTAIGSQVEEQVAVKLEQNPDQIPTGENGPGMNQEESGDNNVGDSAAGYSYGILRADADGNLRVYESMSEYSNVPVEWCYPEECVKALYQAFNTGESVSSKVQNEKGMQNILFIPIVFSDGTVYGVLSLFAEGGFLEYQTWYYEWNLRTMSVLMLLFISVILILLLVVFLMPLKKLKRCAERLEAGEMGVTVPVRGHNEIANIASAFNSMSVGIAAYVHDMKEMSDGYYKFVPAKILELLGKETIQEVQLGDEITENMTILSLHMEYPRQSLTMSAEERYKDINRLLALMVSPIACHNGVVEHFEDSGLSAFFTENSIEALEAAIEMQRALNTEGNGRIATVAITYGCVMIGVIGSENRMETATISAHTNLAKELRFEGEKYGAKILATHLVYRQVPEFGRKYHARYLGNVYVSASDTLERIYDVYDGDEEEEFYYKELTKPMFEKGVELFVARKFYDARLVFVEVLKQHRRDKAAKEYLYRCDNYYRMSHPEQADTLIGRF